MAAAGERQGVQVQELVQQLSMIGLIALAMLLGGAVGYERERSDKPAGLRTHMLVSGGACLIALIGAVLIEDFGGIGGDPSRTLHGIVTGIGFLGAGSIIKNEGRTEGLTTAASILFVAAIGAGVAYGQWLAALGATLLVLVTLGGLRWVERRVLGTRARRRGRRRRAAPDDD
jgi:putative Mg2+ transporter-C (MgtC) family protein